MLVRTGYESFTRENIVLIEPASSHYFMDNILSKHFLSEISLEQKLMFLRFLLYPK